MSALKRFLAQCIAAFLRLVYTPMKLLRTHNKITLISRQQDTPSLDLEMLAEHLRTEFPDWRVDILAYEFHSSLAKKIGYCAHVFTQMRHIAQSRLVVLDTYCIPASVLNHKQDLKIIQMWHALGSIKKFGYSILDVGEGSSSDIARIMRMHHNYDVVLSSSQASAPAFAQAFDVPLSRVAVAPLPRVDALLDSKRMAAKRAELLKKYPDLADGNNVLFAPTFQKGQVFAADELHKYFARNGYNLIAKPHPVALTGSDSSARRYEDVSAFDFLSVADYLVTDYSSIMLEAGVADIPVFLLAPDLDRYLRERDFYIDFASEVPAPISATFDQLVADLKAFDGNKGQLRAFTNTYVQVPADCSCTEQIVRLARELVAG